MLREREKEVLEKQMEELVDNHQDRHDEKVHGGDFG